MPEVFDLNNAFVYYLNRLDPVTGGKVIDNYLTALDATRVQLAAAGNPTYSPPLTAKKSLVSRPEVLASSTFENGSSVMDTATFVQSQTNTASFSVAVTQGLKIGAQAKLTAKIPFFEAEVSLSAEAALSSTETTTSTDSQTFSINTDVNVPPNSRIQASLVINSLRYSGQLTANVLVSGQLGIHYNGGFRTVLIRDVFSRILGTPPAAPFSVTDKTGATYTFTGVDASRFRATAPTGVLYTSLANVTANFGANQSVQIQQFDLKSGQLVKTSNL